VSDNWFAGMFRMHVFPRVAAIAMSSQRVRTAAFRTLSQTGISYPQSPLSRTLELPNRKAPRAGERFPWLTLTFASDAPPEDLFERLDDRRFNLLVIGQPAPDAESFGLGDLLRVHDIPIDDGNARALATASITAPAYYLLRPDGHIGLAGTRFDASAVAQWFCDSHVHPTNVAREAKIVDRAAS
jgi:hypothetical protein